MFAFKLTTLLSELFLSGDFNKTTLEAELQCGSKSCFEVSLEESKICKPFVKLTKNLDEVTLVLLIMNGVNIWLMVCFDLLLLKLHSKGHKNPKKPICTLLFVVLFAGTILYLSSKSFDKALFCTMNMREKICAKQGNFRHEGALHTSEDPVYVSAPCKVFPVGVGGSRDFDIIDISQIASPCSLELRSNFFIENFQMSATVNPNDFVLLDGETVTFASYIDFHSWSKQGSAILDPRFFVY